MDPLDIKSPFPFFLPLDVFDNTEFDCRTPQDWLALGKDGKEKKPVPGKALISSGIFIIFLE